MSKEQISPVQCSQFIFFKLLSKSVVVREGFCDQRPEPSGMIVLRGVAQFMNNNIVGKFERKKYNPVIEAQIVLL